MIDEAVILAGGRGERMQGVLTGVPKPMAPVRGKPFLEYLLSFLRRNRIHKVILSVGYHHSQIQAYFGTRSDGLDIVYARENEPLGTGGGLMNAMRYVTSRQTFVLNGDSYFDIDLEKFYEFASLKRATVCIALAYVSSSGRYGTVETDAAQRITGFREKSESGGPGYINAGIYIMNRSFAGHTAERKRFSLEKEYFERHFRDTRMFGFQADAYFIDIGVPEDYRKAQDEFKRFEY
jgi:D-glycero-alpha-D-manno-heptose 1-phosphate guanylyltransferase